MNLHKHQLYLWEEHSDSFQIWSAIIRINTEGNSSIMKLGLGVDRVYSYVTINWAYEANGCTLKFH